MSSLLPLLLTLSALSGTADTPQRESSIRERPNSLTLETADGLALTLNRANGSAASLAIGAKSLDIPSKPLIRFEEVIESPDAPNLLGPGLDTWNAPAGTIEDAVNGHSGPWLQVSGADETQPRRTLELNHSEPQPLVLSGWCQADVHGEAVGWMNANLALNIYGTYTDGNTIPEQSAYFGQYDHGPQFNARVLCPDKPLAGVDIALTAPRGASTAWYKDVSLRLAEYRIRVPMASCERIDARIVQEFDLRDMTLRGLAMFQAASDFIELRCRFQSAVKTDRAISAYFAVPFDAVGGVWWDDFRRSRRVEAGRLYRNSKWYGAGRDGYDSIYPIGCVQTADGRGLAIGTSVEEPRVFQIEYDAATRELRIRFDFGLSPDAGQWANRAGFTAYLFCYDARDGFRGATEKYDRMFPWAFLKKRVEREGLWLAFLSPKGIPGGWEGLHFQFIEALGDFAWQSQQGMYSFKYVEPWISHHESPEHAPFEETRGPAVPQAAIERAKTVAARRDPETPPDSRHRYAGYLASYIADNWGQPQGYFFRKPGGRNENMMIVNPHPALPPEDSGPFVPGDLDAEAFYESAQLWKQWSLHGWTAYRAGARPCFEVDSEQKASGNQSLRFPPARSATYWEQYTRGIRQAIYCGAAFPGCPFNFSFSARAENLPASGTRLEWTVQFQHEDESVESHTIPLENLTPQWQRFNRALSPTHRPAAVTVLLANPPWFPDHADVWIDDVRLTASGTDTNLLENGDFEVAELLEGHVDGVYLDTLECYANNLNYRRSHWSYAEEPLTFDSARKPALQQQFSHVSYAKCMANRLHARDKLVFGNCAPETCFAAPYLDIMGGEENWLPGGRWMPTDDSRFNFVRFMCRAKPFCLLQYGDLTREQQEKYIKRCLFYGVFPGNQSNTGPAGLWYWTNPMRVARDRPLYEKYMPILATIAQAGWQPITLATADNPTLWLERFGNGLTIYLTAFNPTDHVQRATITLDSRAETDAESPIVDLLQGASVEQTTSGTEASFQVVLPAEDVRVFRIDRATLQQEGS